MKTIIFLLLITLTGIGANAQTINADTLAKYSKKDEQLKVLEVIGRDIHLDDKQQATFNQTGLLYANQAIAVLHKEDQGKIKTLQALKKIGDGCLEKFKTFLTPEQVKLLKAERGKYKFGRRFLVSK